MKSERWVVWRLCTASTRLGLLERMTSDTASQSAASMQIKEKWFTQPNSKQTMFGCSSTGMWFLMWLREKKNQLHSLSFGKMTPMGALAPPELQCMGKVDPVFFFFPGHGIFQRVELEISSVEE